MGGRERKREGGREKGREGGREERERKREGDSQIERKSYMIQYSYYIKNIYIECTLHNCYASGFLKNFDLLNLVLELPIDDCGIHYWKLYRNCIFFLDNS